MRLVVELGPRGDEGPVAIELESPRALGLPAGAHLGLGVTFRLASTSARPSAARA
jgi:hypothetical protein